MLREVQSASYLTSAFVHFLILIHYYDHNKLSIINRFIKTIHDMKNREPNTHILDLFNSYNDMSHRFLKYKSPNEIAPPDELEYISSMINQVNLYKFKPGESVLIILDTNPFVKKSTNLSKESYIIDSKEGNQFIISSGERSVDTGYRSVKSANNFPLTGTIKNGKKGIVKEICSYNSKKDTYSILYKMQDNSVSKDTIKA